MNDHHISHAGRALVLALTLLTTCAAHAQYSWAELDMHAPSVEPTNPALRPCNLGIPRTMSATGDVMGWADVRSGTMIDYSSFKIVSAYKRVVLKWPGTSSGLIKPTVISSTVMPLYMNKQGSWAGYIPAKTTFAKCRGVVNYLTDTPAVQIGTQVTKLRYGINGINFEVFGINNQNWVLGTTLDSVGNRKGLVWKAGKFTELESGGAELVFPQHINDYGHVSGHVVPSKDPEHWVEHAALWLSNKLIWKGPPKSRVVSLNALGDVVWLDQSDPQNWRTYLRVSGVDTPIPLGGVLSSRRTILGAAPPNPDVPADTTPVIWSATGQTWLFDDMRRQGVTLPCDPVNAGICDRSTLIPLAELDTHQVVLSRAGVSTPSQTGLRYYRLRGLP